MRSIERPFDVARALSPWLMLWLVLFLIYDQLIKSKVTLPAAEHLMYGVQLLSDIFISWMSYRAYRAQKMPFERRFLASFF